MTTLLELLIIYEEILVFELILIFFLMLAVILALVFVFVGVVEKGAELGVDWEEEELISAEIFVFELLGALGLGEKEKEVLEEVKELFIRLVFVGKLRVLGLRFLMGLF